MNILITQDAHLTNDLTHEHWSIATSFFTHRKLLHAIATLVVIQNDPESGETYDEAIDETIAQLISNRTDEEDERFPPFELDDTDRADVATYLKDAVKSLRPYMPSGGSLELVTYVSEPENDKLYLVVRYHPNDEHSGKAFASPGLRG